MQSLGNDTAVARVIGSGTFADRLGVLQLSRDREWCLTIADSTLPPGTPLLVVFSDTSEAAVRGVIETRRASECTTPSDEWGHVIEDGVSWYRVVLALGQSPMGPAIVVAGRPNAMRTTGGVVSIDIDGDGRPEHFAQCSSSEGIHLTVTTGTGPAAIARWHQYYYVPYDLEPNCKDGPASKDTAGAPPDDDEAS